MARKDNITSLRTGVLCVPYSVESAGIGPPALKEEGMPMEYTTLHNPWTIPLELTEPGCSEGWLPR